MNQKVHVARNLKCLFENKGLFKVTASHVHSKCGNSWEMVEDGVIVTTDGMPKDVTNLCTVQDRTCLVYAVDRIQHIYDTSPCLDRSMSNLCTLHGLSEQQSTLIELRFYVPIKT